ncbi:lipid kinase, partial [Novimethylophilus kurashikiensis]
ADVHVLTCDLMHQTVHLAQVGVVHGTAIGRRMTPDVQMFFYN